MKERTAWCSLMVSMVNVFFHTFVSNDDDLFFSCCLWFTDKKQAAQTDVCFKPSNETFVIKASAQSFGQMSLFIMN